MLPLGAFALAVAMAACTPSSGTPGPSPTSAQEPSPASPSPSATDAGPTREEQVGAVWEAVHEERLAQLYVDAEPDADGFSDLATDSATDELLDLIRIGRSDVPTELAGSEFWASVEVTAGRDEATVSDCILVATRAASQPDAEPTVLSQVWTGTAISTPDGWRLDSVSVGADNCVPPELNEQLLDAYGAWHDAKNEWWDPPDPDHSLLEQMMIEPGLSEARDLLTEHRDMGIVLRDAHELDNAVVFELGLGTARISDCFPAYPDNIAAYDQETEERREDLSPEPTPGQIDRTVLDLERTPDGEWKANGWRSSSNSDCTPGGTPYVVAP